MRTLIVDFVTVCIMMFIIGNTGITFGDWEFWAVLGCYIVGAINNGVK